MTLTNYWWEIIWLFAGGALISYLFPLKTENVLGKNEKRWKQFAAIILVIPYMVWSGFRGDVYGDTPLYKEMFHGVPSSLVQLPSYLATNTKDRGYTVLATVFKTLFGDRVELFFLLCAIFQLLCIVVIFRKYSDNYWISIFLFIVSTDYMSWMHNGMRQFIAVCGIFLCFDWILKKKYIPTVIVILLLSLIHGSALIMLPIIFVLQGKAWNVRTILFVIAVGITIVLVDRFVPFLNTMLADTQYETMINNEIWTEDNGTNLIRVLVYSVPAILSLIGKKYVDEANNPMINMCVNASAVTAILYLLSAFTSGIYFGRLPIYTTLYGYVMLPWLLNHMFTKDSAAMATLLMIVFYLLFFYYQMHMTWGIL